jgi:hypothetical protein
MRDFPLKIEKFGEGVPVYFKTDFAVFRGK